MQITLHIDWEAPVVQEHNQAEELALTRFLAVLKTGQLLAGEELISTIQKPTYPLKPTTFVIPGANSSYYIILDEPKCKLEPITDERGKPRTRKTPVAHADLMTLINVNGSETTMKRETIVVSAQRHLKAWSQQNPHRTPSGMMFNTTFLSNLYAFNRILHAFTEDKPSRDFSEGCIDLQGQSEHLKAQYRCLISKDTRPKIATQVTPKDAKPFIRIYESPHTFLAFQAAMNLLDIDRLKYDPFEL